MHSAPINLGTHSADAAGNVTYDFTVPTSAASGAHELVFSGVGKTVSFPFVVSSQGSTVVSDPTTTSHTGLAATGQDLGGPIALGILALLLGGGLLHFARYRVLYRGRHGY